MHLLNRNALRICAWKSEQKYKKKPFSVTSTTNKIRLNMDGIAEGDLDDPLFGDIVHSRGGGCGYIGIIGIRNSHAAELWNSRMKVFI